MFKAKCMILIAVLVCFTLSLAGCATSGKKDTAEPDLKDRIANCERQLQEKEQQVLALEDALTVTIQEQENLKVAKEFVGTAKKYTTEDIQKALKNAGFNPGAIDGKMGKQTKEAIKAFQKANGLVVDGRVGKKTWAILSNYLDTKIK